MKIDGNAINDSLYNFKLWFGDFTIELSPLLVLLGMLMTGVDVLLNGRLATNLYFEVPWAIVQIIAIDGLWFAVLLRILEYKHSLAVWPILRYIVIVVVAGSMVVVAFVMTDIVLVQQVQSMGSSLQAMQYLGVPVAWFTHFRAMLLVATATIAMLFSHSHSLKRVTRKAKEATEKPQVQTTIREVESTLQAIPQVTQSTQKRSPEYSRLYDFMAQNRSQLKYENIATMAQVSYGMVKKHAPSIKKELGI